jgi:hypothetical protein
VHVVTLLGRGGSRIAIVPAFVERKKAVVWDFKASAQGTPDIGRLILPAIELPSSEPCEGISMKALNSGYSTVLCLLSPSW